MERAGCTSATPGRPTSSTSPRWAGLEDLDLLEDAEDADLDELLGEDFDSYADDVDLGEVLRGALLEDYEDALPEELDEALLNIFDTLTPAESFNIGKALSQIEKGAAQALADPTVSQIATTALPIAGATAGTYFGGPGAGTAVGASLGSAAAKALPTSGKAGPASVKTVGSTAAPGQPPPAKPPVARGSDAATKALVLTQDPTALLSLVALALGEHGRKSVNGVPVGAVMNLLSTVFGQAAADADELLYASEEMPAYLLDGEGYPSVDPAAPADRAQALYAALLGAENESLSEATGWR
jgi:hypothetical protein